MPMPRFLGIGAPRCGTRWLAQCLSEHPQIELPEGEIYFFTQRRVVESNWKNGLDWYSNKFEKCDGPGIKTWGEITPTYLLDEESPNLIHECAPDVKLICCVRDQFERAYSYYRLFLKFNPSLYFTDYSFRRYLTYSNEVFSYEGFYYSHLKRFFEVFKRDNILISLFDDLRNDPITYLKNIFSFLGVDDSFLPPSADKSINTMDLRVARSRFIQRKTQSQIRKKGELNSLWSMIDRANTYDIPMSGLTRNHRKDLGIKSMMAEIYDEHNREFGEFLGRDLSHWNR